MQQGVVAEKLAKLDAVKINSFIQTLKDPSCLLEELADQLDLIISSELQLSLPAFCSKSFSLNNPEFNGPLWSLPKTVIASLSDAVGSLSLTQLSVGLYGLSKEFIETQKKAANGKCNTYKKTIGQQILIQIILVEFPDLFALGCGAQKSACEQLFLTYQTSFANNTAVGHTLLWMCNSCRVQIGLKVLIVPSGFSIWFNHLLELFTDDYSSSAASVRVAALDYLQECVVAVEYMNNVVMKKSVKSSDVSFSSFLQFAKLVKCKPLTGKNKENAALLSSLYSKVKNIIFDDQHKYVVMNVEVVDMKAVLKSIGVEEASMKEELIDIYIKCAAQQCSSYYKTAKNKSPLAPSLSILVDNYRSFPTQVGDILSRLVDDTLDTAKSGVGSDFYKIGKNGLERLCKNLILDNKKSSKSDGMDNEVIKRLNTSAHLLLRRIPGKEKSLLRFTFKAIMKALVVYFIYYTIVNVACNKSEQSCSNETCKTYQPIGCPLDAQPIRQIVDDYEKNYQKQHLRMWNKYAQPYIDYTSKVALPKMKDSLVKVYDGTVKPIVNKGKEHKVYKEYIKPSLDSSKKYLNSLPFIQNVKRQSIQQHIKDTWHGVSRYTVFVGLPFIRDKLDDGKTWYVQRIHPTVLKTSASVRSKIEPMIMRTYTTVGEYFGKSIDHIRETETYKKVWSSQYGKIMYLQYTDTIKPAFKSMKTTIKQTGYKFMCTFGSGSYCDEIEPDERVQMMKDHGNSVWQFGKEKVLNGVEFVYRKVGF